MISAIPLLFAVLQTTTTVRPAGVSPEFHAACDAVESALAAKDFAKANRLMRLLPKEVVTYEWDDSKVPTNLKDEYARARDRAIKTWTTVYSHLKLTPGPNPGLRITFEPVLADDPQTGYPKALATFFSDAPDKPRLEAVIGLKRGPKKQDTSPVNVENEVRYSIGNYLGLGPSPIFGPAMGRTDLVAAARTLVTNREASIASNVQDYILALRDRIAKKTPMANGQPKAFTDTVKIDLGRIVQGEHAEAVVQLTNTGSGPLAFTMMPDCGCIRTSPAGTIAPGATKLLKTEFDSTEFVGEQNKRVLIYTNDPDMSSFIIPVKVNIQPSYRFVRPEGDVLSVQKRQGQLDVYLYFPKGSDIVPTTYRLDGLAGEVKMEEWSGTLEDPALNEGPLPRQGYKFSVEIKSAIPVGRAGVTLAVDTTSQRFPTLMYTFFVQKGIIALPVNVYLGELGAAPKTASFLVTRPGKAFKVLGVETNSPNLAATFEPGKKNEEYTVTLKYDGAALPGELKTTLKVKTDDPDQPILDVPVRATVR